MSNWWADRKQFTGIPPFLTEQFKRDMEKKLGDARNSPHPNRSCHKEGNEGVVIKKKLTTEPASCVGQAVGVAIYFTLSS